MQRRPFCGSERLTAHIFLAPTGYCALAPVLSSRIKNPGCSFCMRPLEHRNTSDRHRQSSWDRRCRSLASPLTGRNNSSFRQGCCSGQAGTSADHVVPALHDRQAIQPVIVTATEVHRYAVVIVALTRNAVHRVGIAIVGLEEPVRVVETDRPECSDRVRRPAPRSCILRPGNPGSMFR